MTERLQLRESVRTNVVSIQCRTLTELFILEIYLPLIGSSKPVIIEVSGLSFAVGREDILFKYSNKVSAMTMSFLAYIRRISCSEGGRIMPNM